LPASPTRRSGRLHTAKRKKITKTHFSMTEVYATTARVHFLQRETAPAACKLASPQSPSHGQCECYFCQLRYFVLLYSLAVWRTLPNFCWALSNQKGMSYLAK
jgi:hypothetical protein